VILFFSTGEGSWILRSWYGGRDTGGVGSVRRIFLPRCCVANKGEGAEITSAGRFSAIDSLL
jgi:hypothetical protein